MRQARSAVVLVVKVLELLVGEPRIVQERAAGRGPRLPQGLLARFDAGLVEDVVGEKAGGAWSLGKMGASWYHIRAVAEAEEGHLVVLLEEALRVGVEVLGRRTEGRERGVGVLLGAGLGRSLVSARELARTARARARVKPDLPPGFDGDGMPLTMPASYLSSPGRMSPPPPSPKRPGWPRVGGMLDS